MMGINTGDGEEDSRQQESIHFVLASCDWKTSHLIPTWQDFDVLDSILAARDPLGELTDVHPA